jgi:tRNA dimethylallyltransferase
MLRHPDPTAPGWSAIGCAELFQYLAGESDLPSCKAAWLRNTRAYAKRQITWFRRNPAPFSFSPEAEDDILRLCESFLRKGEADASA